jgi:hypothetical protein
MITAFLLFPVMGVLSWLYWRLLPGNRRWRIFDSALFAVIILMAIAYVRMIKSTNWPGAGPLWPDLLSAVGAYAILAIGLATGLAWRRSRS